jgi:hypothetical protein
MTVGLRSEISLSKEDFAILSGLTPAFSAALTRLKFHLRHAEGSSRGSGSESNFAGAGDSLFLTAAGGLLGSEGVIFRVATSIGFSLLPG